MRKTCPNCGTVNNRNEEYCNDCGLNFKSLKNVKKTVFDNRYEVVKLLSQGGMGRVYKAFDIRIKGYVAVKEMLDYFGDGIEEAEAIRKFEAEAQILFDLHHSGLPKVSDQFSEVDSSGRLRHYLVMSFIEGKDLHKIMKERNDKPLDVKKAVDYFVKILEILKYLHSQNPPIIYRDMKPQNIMISSENNKAAKEHLFLVDFGIAKKINPSVQTMTGTSIGSIGYASIEQCKGKTTKKSDLYSLGVLMHYLLSGIDPQDPSVTPWVFESLKKTNSKVPEYLSDIIHKMLENDPANRPDSASEILECLKNRKTTGKGKNQIKTVSRGGVKQNVNNSNSIPISLAVITVIVLVFFYINLQKKTDVNKTNTVYHNPVYQTQKVDKTVLHKTPEPEKIINSKDKKPENIVNPILIKSPTPAYTPEKIETGIVKIEDNSGDFKLKIYKSDGSMVDLSEVTEIKEGVKSIALTPGSYTIMISKKNFYPYTRKSVLEKDSILVINPVWIKFPEISIKTNVEANVTVKNGSVNVVNNTKTSMKNAFIKILKDGKYKIVISKSGYKSINENVELKKGDGRRSFVYNLEKIPQKRYTRSTPDNYIRSAPVNNTNYRKPYRTPVYTPPASKTRYTPVPPSPVKTHYTPPENKPKIYIPGGLEPDA